jgi:3alpha(or 20beta)-hydroxysteroid dehydrogenase
MRERLSGKYIVVTGAARGQGAAEVAQAAREGADILATDVLDDAGNDLVSGLAGLPGQVSYRHLDVSSAADWQAVAAELAGLGRVVHGLVNNAGVPMRARLAQVTVADWDRTLAINLTGPLLGIQAMLPLMRAGGSIVNVGSVAALTAHHTVAYTASKWGLRGLSKVAAVECGRLGIRCNTVHPGLIDTPMMDGASAAFIAAHLSLTPLERAGQPGDVASLVTFLLSDESAYITGAEIAVDGGYSAHGGAKAVLDAVDGTAQRSG